MVPHETLCSACEHYQQLVLPTPVKIVSTNTNSQLLLYTTIDYIDPIGVYIIYAKTHIN